VRTAPGAIPFTRHPASRGVVWLKEAWVMLSAARLPWLMLLLSYYLIQIVVGYVPVVGPLAMMVLRPVFTVGFLAAAWNQERGGMPEMHHLFRGFGADLRALIAIGAFLVVGTTLAIFATMAVDGGELLEAIAANKPLDEALAGSQVELAMLFATLCAVPVVLAAWFAPALVVFNGCGAKQALGTSLRAALANWRPVAIYALLLLFLGGLLPALVVKMISLALPLIAARIVVALTVFPYLLFFIAAQAISDYISYRDIFHADEGPAPPDEPEPGTTA
jgi:hypothetical protein